MLEVQDLAKAYGERVAVQNVNFTAESGRTLGLLGPNGAGKSTVVNIVAGLLRPDRGEVRIHGRLIESDTSAVKLLVGFVPQDLALYEELSALDNLRLFGALYGLQGAELAALADAALAVAKLADRAGDRGTKRCDLSPLPPLETFAAGKTICSVSSLVRVIGTTIETCVSEWHFSVGLLSKHIEWLHSRCGWTTSSD